MEYYLSLYVYVLFPQTSRTLLLAPDLMSYTQTLNMYWWNEFALNFWTKYVLVKKNITHHRKLSEPKDNMKLVWVWIYINTQHDIQIIKDNYLWTIWLLVRIYMCTCVWIVYSKQYLSILQEYDWVQEYYAKVAVIFFWNETRW